MSGHVCPYDKLALDSNCKLRYSMFLVCMQKFRGSLGMVCSLGCRSCTAPNVSLPLYPMVYKSRYDQTDNNNNNNNGNL